MKTRKKEFQFILKQAAEIKNPILIAGDFNNNRRNTPVKIWNLNILEDLASNHGFILYTPPNDSSIRETNSDIPEDHFLLKGLDENGSITSYKYDREFTLRQFEDKNGKIIYKWGENFRNYENWKAEYIPSPYPDHAMLIGNLQLEENRSNNKQNEDNINQQKILFLLLIITARIYWLFLSLQQTKGYSNRQNIPLFLMPILNYYLFLEHVLFNRS